VKTRSLSFPISQNKNNEQLENLKSSHNIVVSLLFQKPFVKSHFSELFEEESTHRRRNSSFYRK